MFGLVLPLKFNKTCYLCAFIECTILKQNFSGKKSDFESKCFERVWLRTKYLQRVWFWITIFNMRQILNQFFTACQSFKELFLVLGGKKYYKPDSQASRIIFPQKTKCKYDLKDLHPGDKSIRRSNISFVFVSTKMFTSFRHCCPSFFSIWVSYTHNLKATKSASKTSWVFMSH